MAVWLVRAGRYGDDEAFAIKKGVAIIGWHEVPQLTDIDSIEAMRKRLHDVYPDISVKGAINQASQLWSFIKRIRKRSGSGLVFC